LATRQSTDTVGCSASPTARTNAASSSPQKPDGASAREGSPRLAEGPHLVERPDAVGLADGGDHQVELAEPRMAAISQVEYGHPDSQADLMRGLCPIPRIGRPPAATLVLHGANDTPVPVIEPAQVAAGQEARGIPVESVPFPDEGHRFRRTGNRARSVSALVHRFEQRPKVR
jgi:Prolyl oligopeptidase family